MAATFPCSIVTPTRTVFDDEVSYVSFPAWDGQHGVMTGQSPLLSELGIGAVRIDGPDNVSHWYLVEGGFAQMHEGALTLLTPRATPANDLSLQDADAALAEAAARIPTGGKDLAAIERDQQRALATKALARAHGS
jgi:F-type H+-transporting ATPase subunit epsilon